MGAIAFSDVSRLPLSLFQHYQVIQTILLIISTKDSNVIALAMIWRICLLSQALLILQQCCAAAAAAKSIQLCRTLCDLIDGSPPGSSIPEILQARTLEWVAISFSNACMHAKSLQLCPTLCDPMDSSPPGSSVHGILQARILEWVAISFSHNSVVSRILFQSTFVWITKLKLRKLATTQGNMASNWCNQFKPRFSLF